MVVVGGKYFIFPAAAAAGRPALALGHHLTLLPRGPAAEQTVGSPRSHHHCRHSSATTPGLISAAVGRTAPPLGWEHASSSRKQVAAESGPPTRTPGKSMPAPPPPPNSPKPPPRIDDGRGVGLPHRLRHHAPPFITPRPLPTLRRGVRIRKFWCPVSGGFPPDHLLPGAMGHRSLHCLGAGPAQDPRPPIQAPPACQASSQHNYHDPGFQIHIDATQLVPCLPPVLVT